MNPAFWQSPALAAVPGVAHGVSHRTGGVSKAPFDSLNLGLHVGDDPASVIENRQIAAAALGFALESMVCAAQVHGGDVAVVTEADSGRGADDAGQALPGVDALVTDRPGVLLALFFADCVPVLLADADGRAVGVAHAGWRGLVAGVVENTVTALRESFAVTSDRLVCAVGPCIGPDAFEVGEEVAGHFPRSAVRPPDGGRPHVDLKRETLLRLVAAGVPEASITVAEDCTVASPGRWFSHRRDHGRTGRMGALIGIRPRG